MTIQELEQKLNECQKALAELKESKKEGKWLPKEGEKYWWRNDIGAIDCDEVCNTTAHDWQLKNLPIFKTDQECRRYWHFMDTVKEKSYEFSREDFEDYNIDKHYIFYDFMEETFEIGAIRTSKSFGEIYFKTEEDAEYIINNFKEELFEYWV